jgi:MFS family permease
MGKAIRSPARDTLLSHATAQVGRGWGFGLHEALDQIGAVIGPLALSAVFLLQGGYRNGFALLLLPAVAALVLLTVARSGVPRSTAFEHPDARAPQGQDQRLPALFWLYTVFIIFSVAGFASFQLMSYHFKVTSVVPDAHIPLLYAVAMGVDALAALATGKLYDRAGFKALLLIPVLTTIIPFLAFSRSYALAVASAVLWGAVMGTHETVMRAAIADIAPLKRRGTAYGIFNTAYGLAWFVGGSVTGILYGLSPRYISIFVVVMEVLSLPAFLSVVPRGKPS